ncbi:hypothetical protein Dalk_4928 [Desulfatibacillum aliphaticivorans]|uniref:Uncharacterized protein n=1 Tax=Desulfatibacillum aliphaticivorans TaxID=218208 RepID=B8FDH2_DESAL|nr:hypothetical protein Dalk_4928 [Desulfatibacillum aliphaticivorans]
MVSAGKLHNFGLGNPVTTGEETSQLQARRPCNYERGDLATTMAGKPGGYGKPVSKKTLRPPYIPDFHYLCGAHLLLLTQPRQQTTLPGPPPKKKCRASPVFERGDRATTKKRLRGLGSFNTPFAVEFPIEPGRLGAAYSSFCSSSGASDFSASSASSTSSASGSSLISGSSEESKTGCGPQFSALVAQLSGVCRESRETVRDFIRSVLGVPRLVQITSDFLNGRPSDLAWIANLG